MDLPKKLASRGALRVRYQKSKSANGDRGYELKFGKDLPVKRGVVRGEATIAGGWRSDDELPPVQCVCAMFDDFEDHEIVLGEGRLLADLLSLRDDSDAVVAFAIEWGLLTAGKWQTVESFFELKRRMISLQALGREYGPAAVLKRLSPSDGRAKIELLGVNKDGEPEIGIYLQTMRGFLTLEVALMCGGATQIARCANPKCKKWYARKAKGSHAQFCSHACRQMTWRAAQNDDAPADEELVS